MIEWSIIIILIGLVLCIFSLIFNLLPEAMFFHRKKSFEPSRDQKILKILDVFLIIFVIEFIVSLAGNIVGLIVYIC